MRQRQLRVLTSRRFQHAVCHVKYHKPHHVHSYYLHTNCRKILGKDERIAIGIDKLASLSPPLRLPPTRPSIFLRMDDNSHFHINNELPQFRLRTRRARSIRLTNKPSSLPRCGTLSRPQHRWPSNPHHQLRILQRRFRPDESDCSKCDSDSTLVLAS